MKNKIEFKVAYKGENNYRIEEYRNGVLVNEGRLIYKNYTDARRSEKVKQKFYDKFYN